MTDYLEHARGSFSQLKIREMWTYRDGTRSVKAFRRPEAGGWVLVDPKTEGVEGVVPPGEFSRRFRPVDVFADVTGFATYLGTVTASDGTALVDLILDRNPFMLANGPRRVARPHALTVPRRHRDGWSGATSAELAACRTAMILLAAWYQSTDEGYVVFAANDSAANVDYLRDTKAGAVTVTKKNPRQDAQHAHLHAFYAERSELENQEASAVAGHRVMAAGHRAFGAALGGDALKVEAGGAGLAANVRAAAKAWGGSYCSYQLGVDGAFWIMPALGAAQDEFNRWVGRADGLVARPDAGLGGAVNVVRPGLEDAERAQAAERATAEQRAGFETFLARRGLNARSLPVGLGS